MTKYCINIEENFYQKDRKLKGCAGKVWEGKYVNVFCFCMRVQPSYPQLLN